MISTFGLTLKNNNIQNLSALKDLAAGKRLYNSDTGKPRRAETHVDRSDSQSPSQVRRLNPTAAEYVRCVFGLLLPLDVSYAVLLRDRPAERAQAHEDCHCRCNRRSDTLGASLSTGDDSLISKLPACSLTDLLFWLRVALSC